MPSSAVASHRHQPFLTIEEVLWLIIVPILLTLTLMNLLWAIVGTTAMNNSVPIELGVLAEVITVAILMTYTARNSHSRGQVIGAPEIGALLGFLLAFLAGIATMLGFYLAVW